MNESLGTSDGYTTATTQTADESFDQIIRIPLATNPLNLNRMRSMHWATKGKLTKQWRLFAGLSAKRFPALSHVTVTLTWFVTDRRVRDDTNLWGLFKPLADGLVDAGVVPDDNPQYMTSACLVERAPEGVKTAYMELRVQSVPEPVALYEDHLEIPVIAPQHINPDCVNGKHHACNGDAWDFTNDLECLCECACHGQADAA